MGQHGALIAGIVLCVAAVMIVTGFYLHRSGRMRRTKRRSSRQHRVARAIGSNVFNPLTGSAPTDSHVSPLFTSQAGATRRSLGVSRRVSVDEEAGVVRGAPALHVHS